MVCTVSYDEYGGSEPRTFKNVYKFQVTNPLAMKNTKITPFKDGFFVQYELYNLLDSLIYVESVKFENPLAYDLIDHSTHNKGPEYEHPLLKGESRRFLYQLKSKDPFGKIPLVFGKVLINWRISINQTGQMISSIQHKGLTKPEIEIVVQENQDLNVETEKPFKLSCIVYNRTGQKVDLVLNCDHEKMYPLCFNGISTKKLGNLESNSSLDVNLELFSMETGIQSISGVSIKDTITGKSFTPQNLCSVLVK